MQKSKIFKLILILLVSSVLLAGCTGTGLATSWPGITVQDDTVYTSFSTGVYAVSSKTGSLIWRYPEKAGKSSFYAAPAVSDQGQVVVGDYSHALHLLDARSGLGKTIFVADDKWIAQPIINGDVIYAANADHNLYALDLGGNILWKFETGSMLWSNPILEGSTLYLGGMDGNLYAIDATNGREMWKTDCGGAIIANISSAGNEILLGTISKEVLAVNKADGKQLWRYQAGSAVWSGPVVRDGVVYFGDMNGVFYALEGTGQKVIWQYQADGSIIGNALVTDQGVFFTVDSGKLIHLDFTGAPVFSKTLGEKLFGSPQLAGEQLLIGTTSKDSILLALDPDGNQVWSFAQPK